MPAYAWAAIGAVLVGIGIGWSNPASRNAGLQLVPDQASAIAALRYPRRAVSMTGASVKAPEPHEPLGLPPRRPHVDCCRVIASRVPMSTATKTNSHTLARLQELLGQHAGFRIDANAPGPKERTRIRASLDAAAVAVADSEVEMESLRPAGRSIDNAGYQRARASYLAHKALADGLSMRLARRRIHVGRQAKSSFKPVAEADTWDELFATLQKKAAA